VERKVGCNFQICCNNKRINIDVVGRGATALRPPLQTPSQKLGGPLLIEGKLFETMPESSNRHLSDFRKHKSFREWFEYISSLERDLVGSTEVVKSLEKKKEDAVMENFRVLEQIEYQKMLLKSSFERLSELERDLEEKTIEESRLREVTPINEGMVASILNQVEELRKAINSEKNVNKAFESLRGSRVSTQDSAM